MAERVELEIDGRRVAAPAGSTVAAAIAIAAAVAQGAGVVTRRSVTGALRGPLCGMGVCQECRVTINGRAHRLACQTLCETGMRVETTEGNAATPRPAGLFPPEGAACAPGRSGVGEETQA